MVRNLSLMSIIEAVFFCIQKATIVSSTGGSLPQGNIHRLGVLLVCVRLTHNHNVALREESSKILQQSP